MADEVMASPNESAFLVSASILIFVKYKQQHVIL